MNKLSGKKILEIIHNINCDIKIVSLFIRVV